MAWIYLMIAGLLEIIWAISLQYSQGFTKLWPTLSFLVTILLSVFLLALALRSLPVGTSYAIWTGIGAAGTAIVVKIALGEPRSVLKILSVVLVIAGIVGLRLSEGS